MAWILGIAMTLLALLGLIVSANAADATMAWVGLFLCGFGILFVYSLIARHSGNQE